MLVTDYLRSFKSLWGLGVAVTVLGPLAPVGTRAPAPLAGRVSDDNGGAVHRRRHPVIQP
jgi:hypothetical protein